MNLEEIEIFKENKIEILEMILKKVDNQLELSLKVNFKNEVFRIIFYNISRFKVGDLSMPLELYGFEIINHFENGWEKDSAYEIRDFEDNRINFFCEYFDIDNRP